jgi:hypothetical protein
MAISWTEVLFETGSSRSCVVGRQARARPLHVHASYLFQVCADTQRQTQPLTFVFVLQEKIAEVDQQLKSTK